MFLFATTILSLVSPAKADTIDCPVPEVDILQTFPQSGDMQVATDAVIRLKMAGGSFMEEPVFHLRNGEQEIAIQSKFSVRASGVDGQVVLVDIQAEELLPAKTEFVLEMERFGEREPVMVFVTNDSVAQSIAHVPSINWISRYPSYTEDTCASIFEDELYFDLYQYDAIPQKHTINVYQVQIDQDVRALTIESLGEPFHAVFDDSNYQEYTAYIPSAEPESMCFVATFVNEAGVVSAMTDVQCVSSEYDHWECGTGMPMACSNIPVSSLGWFGMLLAGLGLRRRQ